ncbi:MAG: hypothetical protein BMS9Abin05_2200 [Rhodothermia bacterium]|nr:MAG: hypothetical protein BMS9Abin05_2200 [Rhodothermia bacterium]
MEGHGFSRQEVTISGLDIPFSDMLRLAWKWILAVIIVTIPIYIIALIIVFLTVGSGGGLGTFT